MRPTIQLVAVVGIFAAGYLCGAARHSAPSEAATLEPAPAIIHAKALAEGLTPISGMAGMSARTIYQSSIGAVGVVRFISTVKLHKHLVTREFLYVLSGSGSGRVGSVESRIGPGDLIVIPRGAPHSFVADRGGVKMLEFDSPPGPNSDVYWLK